MSDYKFVFNRFNRSYGERLAHDVHQKDMEEWLDGHTKSLAPRRVYIKYFNTLFAYAMERGYMAVNPLEGMERPQVILKAPAIFTIEQTISFPRADSIYPVQLRSVREAFRGWVKHRFLI